MKAIGVIPARYESSRFPGKILAKIFDRPLIQYTYEEALKATSLEDLIIATDDQRIFQAVKDFGGRAVMTAKEHQSGTDRLTEVVNPIDAEIIVNIQGDEPLIHFSMINDLVSSLHGQNDFSMVTIIRRIEDAQELNDPNVVKVVKDKHNFALYFSRSLIPHPCSAYALPENTVFYKHIGLYAYTKDFLFTFTNLPVADLEKTEALEQLRALEHGYKIKLIETNFNTVGVDTPEDLEKVKARLLERDANKKS